MRHHEYLVNDASESFQEFHSCDPDRYVVHRVVGLGEEPSSGLTVRLSHEGVRPIEAALVEGIPLALNHLRALCAGEGCTDDAVQSNDMVVVREALIRFVFRGRDDLLAKALDAMQRHAEEEL